MVLKFDPFTIRLRHKASRRILSAEDDGRFDFSIEDETDREYEIIGRPKSSPSEDWLNATPTGVPRAR